MFKRNREIFGTLILLFFLGITFFGDQVAPFDMDQLFAPYLSPGGRHILGTNNIGQDILSELINAARISFMVGFVAAVLATVIGTVIGCAAGYYRSVVDDVLMRITDIFLLIPALPLIIILVSYIGPGIFNVIFVISISSWPGTARVVRANVLKLREYPFIMNARSLGANDVYIMFRHILPNTRELILAKVTLATAYAMLTEAGISFIGLGDPDHTSWGGMLHDVMEGAGLINGLWWWYLPPILCISLAVIGFNFTGYAFLNSDGIKAVDQGKKNNFSGKNNSPVSRDTDMIFMAQNLCISFKNKAGNRVMAVDSVDLTVCAKDKIAVMGETGAGKSILLLGLLKLLPQGARVSGAIEYHGRDMAGFSDEEIRRIRGVKTAYVPQAAGNGLNPVLNIGSQVAERQIIHFKTDKKTALKQAQTLLADMGIKNIKKRISDYPHQFSGGMKQRLLLASAMLSKSGVLLADEPTKGLDMGNKKAILEIINNSSAKACVIVTHDFWFAKRFATTIVVMFQGLIVESGPRESFFSTPFHPFSQSLLAALPSRGLKVRCGYVPGRLGDFQTGCPFLARCDVKTGRCMQRPPLFRQKGHKVRCWHYAS
ncbi:dipeptide/oligopeptide/nickel ABC transporter permease/ATP-binding protein [Desulfobacula sp.]|uniref:dipeptide/oligopeptide/nickel ABC transporter permease/ATP-binding protein n=1 Tax=Desulfobacula sp. TaxID=2593537 RepID=UPI0025BD99B3|nr:dipeptide/oligopeptide/nickel ABC transporter permease/ATP-binding protein [Desulfobacula sp.]MBC2705745.1 dipeptide/oligopeptide/nickel ABC transporter permease/ATP-binding protein [Desulfobacula sp.]